MYLVYVAGSQDQTSPLGSLLIRNILLFIGLMKGRGQEKELKEQDWSRSRSHTLRTPAARREAFLAVITK